MPRGKSSGFALVLALLLMSFVLLLLLTLTTLVRTETGVAGQARQLEAARLNALLGLQEALGRLQATAGPDQRATARAEIRPGAHPDNRYWTGVWPSIDPDDTQRDLENLRTWSYADDQVEWLVSGPSKLDVTQALVGQVPEGTVTLARYKDAASGDVSDVSAGLIKLEDAASVSGGYAWWVADEGVKAKFNLGPDSEAAGLDPSQERLLKQSRLLSPRQYGIGEIASFEGGLEYLALDRSFFERNLGISELETLPDVTDAMLEGIAADLTFHSFGVLADQRHGGLKLDLTRALDDAFPEQLAGRPLWWFRDPSNGKVIRGEYWDVLYDFANLYRDHPAWQFSGSVQDSSYSYSYVPHNGTGPEGLADAGDFTAGLGLRFFGPETTNGRGSFNRQGKNMGTYSYYSSPPTGRHEEDNWGFTDSGNPQGRPVWNAVQPVVLACLWRVGVGTSDLLTYSQSGAFQSDGAPGGVISDFYDLRQYDDVNDTIVYDHPEGTGYGDHPLDLPADWEGRPTSGPSAVQGTPRKYFRLHFVLQPVVVLWNPYNVPLEIDDLLVTPKFEPWVSIDYDDGDGSGVQPVKVQKYMYYRSGGSDVAFRVVEDYPHSPISGSLVSNNPEEAEHRFLLADDGIMAGGELVTGIRIQDETLAPGQIEVFSLNRNTALPNAFGGEMVRRPINTDAVLVRRNPLKHDFPEGTRINSIHFSYRPNNVPDGNSIDGRLHTMDFDVQLLNHDLSPGNKTQPYLQRNSQFAPDAADENDWSQAHVFEVNANIEDIQVPYSGSSMNLNEPFSDVVWFSVIGAQTKSITEDAAGLPMFTQLNPTRFRDAPNPSNRELSGKMWEVRFYTDPEFADAVESEDLPFWDGDSEVWNGVDSIIAKELPRQPLLSVGQFMHANLSISDWDPLYAVGGSYAHPLVDKAEVYNKFNFQTGGNLIGGSDNLALDTSFLTNERLFDPYFFSTVPPQGVNPSKPGYSATFDPAGSAPFRGMVDEDLADAGSLSNPRMRYIGDLSEEGGLSALDRVRDAEGAAAQFLVDGAFNVNSTSVEAWKAFFASLQGSEMLSSAGNEYSHGAKGIFPRASALPVASAGDASDLFTGFKSLDAQQLEDLAEAMVEQVRLRGPFLSLADFVNRRLEDSDLGSRGALQAALDDAINDQPGEFGEAVDFGGGSDPDADLWLQDRPGKPLLRVEHLVEHQGAGLPQWVLQNDVLQAMAPFVQARSDTFVIRAYGEQRNLAGEVEAKVWCEAVVQRLPEYVDDAPSQKPELKPWLVTAAADGSRADTLTANPDLSAGNRDFGRRFRIVAFRWLEPEAL